MAYKLELGPFPRQYRQNDLATKHIDAPDVFDQLCEFIETGAVDLWDDTTTINAELARLKHGRLGELRVRALSTDESTKLLELAKATAYWHILGVSTIIPSEPQSGRRLAYLFGFDKEKPPKNKRDTYVTVRVDHLACLITTESLEVVLPSQGNRLKLVE